MNLWKKANVFIIPNSIPFYLLSHYRNECSQIRRQFVYVEHVVSLKIFKKKKVNIFFWLFVMYLMSRKDLKTVSTT